MLILRCGTKLPNNSQPTDGQVLRERGEGAEEEVKSVLEDYGKFWDWRIICKACREGFDVGPGQVDVEEEEEGTETNDGGLMDSLSVLALNMLFEECVRRACHRHERGG